MVIILLSRFLKWLSLITQIKDLQTKAKKPFLFPNLNKKILVINNKIKQSI